MHGFEITDAMEPGEAATLAALLLDGDSGGGGGGGSSTGSNATSSYSTLPAAAAALPDWQYEPEEFEASLRAKCRQQQMQGFDARRRKLAPLVDAPALLWSMRRGGWSGGGGVMGQVLRLLLNPYFAVPFPPANKSLL